MYFRGVIVFDVNGDEQIILLQKKTEKNEFKKTKSYKKWLDNVSQSSKKNKNNTNTMSKTNNNDSGKVTRYSFIKKSKDNTNHVYVHRYVL